MARLARRLSFDRMFSVFLAATGRSSALGAMRENDAGYVVNRLRRHDAGAGT